MTLDIFHTAQVKLSRPEFTYLCFMNGAHTDYIRHVVRVLTSALTDDMLWLCAHATVRSYGRTSLTVLFNSDAVYRVMTNPTKVTRILIILHLYVIFSKYLYFLKPIISVTYIIIIIIIIVIVMDAPKF
jgi:hypothetical protein